MHCDRCLFLLPVRCVMKAFVRTQLRRELWLHRAFVTPWIVTQTGAHSVRVPLLQDSSGGAEPIVTSTADEAVAMVASTADEAVATVASTDEAVVKGASTADEVEAMVASTGEEVVVEDASTADEVRTTTSFRQCPSLTIDPGSSLELCPLLLDEKGRSTSLMRGAPSFWHVCVSACPLGSAKKQLGPSSLWASKSAPQKNGC